jgi:SAM-dependent methyltransferase
MGSIAEPTDMAARERLHGMWAAVAPGWAEHAAYIDSRGAALTERLLALAELRPGNRVLELACGPGGLGLAAAARVGDEGEVVLSDVAEPMVAIAARRAEALGLANVRTRMLDLEDIDEGDEGFDAALCREGLMFATDHARAARELYRVVRPGGRAVIAVWGPRERNPWLGVVLDAVSAQLGAPVPPPGIPGPFALSDGDRLAGLLAGAGFGDVTLGEQDVPLRAGSFEEWWSRTTALAGPLAKILAALPAEAITAIRARAREVVRQYETAGALELPGVSLVAGARRPS